MMIKLVAQQLYVVCCCVDHLMNNVGIVNGETLGYWHQRADEMHGNPPQGAINGQRQSWKTPR